jgi:hypothetical protein
LKFLSGLSSQLQVQDYRNLKPLELEDLGYFEMNVTIPKKATFLVPPLLPLPLAKEFNKEKLTATDVLNFVLKQRADSTKTALTYTLKVTRFYKGTVAEWTSFQKAISWRHNNVMNMQDWVARVASICTILCIDLLTGFEEKVQELIASTGKDGEIMNIPLNDETVLRSLNAVTQMMFPFRALKTQKQWMWHCMQRP